MNKFDKGYIYLSLSCVLIIVTYIGLDVADYHNPLNIGLITYQYALQAISFFFSIIFGLVGGFYIYGDPEKEFWKISILSMGIILLINLRLIVNFVEYINSLI